MPTNAPAAVLNGLRARIQAANSRRAGSAPVQLVAVGKTRSAAEIAALARLGQRLFGENYVQEARAKQAAIADPGLEWHLIGALQSNKCREAAAAFDCIQTIDRDKLLPLLDRHRPPGRPRLDLLIQVNIDDEASKSGCRPDQVATLAAMIGRFPRLRLRGLMAVPRPDPDPARRRSAFAAMRALFEALARDHPQVDTLSMGMSDDFEMAIEEGATMVRIGTALFGARGVGGAQPGASGVGAAP
jgi:PLP dependent protein